MHIHLFLLHHLNTFYKYMCRLLVADLPETYNSCPQPFLFCEREPGAVELHLAVKLLHKVMLRADPELVSECISLIIKHWAVSSHHQMTKVFF